MSMKRRKCRCKCRYTCRNTNSDGKDIVGMVSVLFTISTAKGGRAAWVEDMGLASGSAREGYWQTVAAPCNYAGPIVRLFPANFTHRRHQQFIDAFLRERRLCPLTDASFSSEVMR